MANGHGGARSGAGRKPHREKYAKQIASLHDQIAEGLDDRYAALQLLADGGYEQVTETWEPAGLIFVEDVLSDNEGKAQRVRRLAFPDLRADQLVCVRRTRSFAAPDRAANIYLIDRIAGRPVQATEVSGPDGAAIPLSIEEAITRAYGGDGDGD